VVVQTVEGRPVFFAQGLSQQAPKGLPRAVLVAGKPTLVCWRQDFVAAPMMTPQKRRVPTDQDPGWLARSSGKQTQTLPEPSNLDLDRSMWAGGTPLRPQSFDSATVETGPKEGEGILATSMPLALKTRVQLALDARLPQYTEPNFWAKPFEPEGLLCCTFYMTPTLVYTFKVPSDHLLVVSGVSVDLIDLGFTLNDIFEITFLRDGSPIAVVENAVVDPTNPDPSKRVAFGDHSEPSPLGIICDHDSTLSVLINYKGPYPFLKDPTDTFCGTINVQLLGWLGSLMDNRDGAPKPVDMGSMNGLAAPQMLDALDDVTLSSLERWLQASLAE
jgi:hypothetical protein